MNSPTGLGHGGAASRASPGTFDGLATEIKDLNSLAEELELQLAMRRARMASSQAAVMLLNSHDGNDDILSTVYEEVNEDSDTESHQQSRHGSSTSARLTDCERLEMGDDDVILSTTEGPREMLGDGSGLTPWSRKSSRARAEEQIREAEIRKAEIREAEIREAEIRESAARRTPPMAPETTSAGLMEEKCVIEVSMDANYIAQITPEAKDIIESFLHAKNVINSMQNAEEVLSLGEADLEEMCKVFMVTSAQLNDDKKSLAYQVDLLRDELSEQTEGVAALRRQYRDKCKDYDGIRGELCKREAELKELTEQLAENQKLISEMSGVIFSDDEDDHVIASRARLPGTSGSEGKGKSGQPNKSGSAAKTKTVRFASVTDSAVATLNDKSSGRSAQTQTTSTQTQTSVEAAVTEEPRIIKLSSPTKKSTGSTVVQYLSDKVYMLHVLGLSSSSFRNRNI